ncbi:hypothetical protein J5N97_006503 [Dioscorea zingiberensis]|uniref:DNA endonuclease activator Ctp1 C-terminal domain-containing protein n=1 Tax=Dioscorea zingiberensis TaxID=325984 RepID=A0A9D5DD70_9LILI|nr:hypothetical protein J5N97_006503 [Dioscorea zingiberensis]
MCCDRTLQKRKKPRLSLVFSGQIQTSEPARSTPLVFSGQIHNSDREGDMKSLTEFEDSIDLDDSKYLCDLSTILVATIQELKDRVSQIEFIFCSQLFPNFQSRSSLLHKRLIQTKKAAEDEWRKKESSLLSQIKDLQLEKQLAQEQVQQLNILLEQSKARLMSTEQSLSTNESEKKQLLDKMEVLERKEEIISELKEQLRQKSAELAKEKELPVRLLQQIELKDQQIAIEQKKRRCLHEESSTKYKQLKSQYNFLLRKTGLTSEYKPSPIRKEDEKNSPRPHTNIRSFQDCGDNNQETTQCASKPSAQNSESTFKEKLDNAGGLIKIKSDGDACVKSRSSSGSLPPTNSACNAQSKETSASSCWKNTRARQEPGGADPHDDFLDTPMEVFRNSKKGPEEDQDLPGPAQKDMDFNNSDDETQDLKEESLLELHNTSVLGPVNKNFKFVEPVRKKSERENLKGIECNQCKKFYDAVLPSNGGEGHDKESSCNHMRCEHHEGVSRHRYRYAPPLTPEGFWNIGFDSDM